VSDEKKEEGRMVLTPAELAGHVADIDHKPFAALYRNAEELKVFMVATEHVIWRSFAEDAQREPFKTIHPTRDEIKRRFRICEAWVRHARGDLGYSMERTVDLMAHALRCELDGVTYDPAAGDKKLWSPT
jgi:hypothetical protein